MAAFDAGYESFFAEQEEKSIAQRKDIEARQEQVGILFEIIRQSMARLNENNLAPFVREQRLLILEGEDELASVSPAASGDSFEIKIGSKTHTFSGDAEGCVQELGKSVARVLFDRKEAERKARIMARRDPSQSGWV